MKKYLVLLLLAISTISSDMVAQGWLNRSVDGYRQRNQQRNVHRNYNSQGTDQNQRRYSEDRSLREQQRQKSQQRIREQQSLKSEEDNNIISLANGNNAGQNDSKTVTLVVDGTGQTKEEAIQNALRSAIEQAFGTFVSANTEVINDELVKDEIATVTSGNINHYDVLSSSQSSNGLYDVSLKASVSIENLTNYAISKGFKVELAGAEFVMNMKIRELNKKNELAAIENLQKKLKTIAKNGGLFDYVLEKSEPIKSGNSGYGIKLKLLFYENDNTKAFYREVYNTMTALSLSKQEIVDYQRIGLNYYVYDKQLIKKSRGEYALRNDYHNWYEWIGNDVETEISWLKPILIDLALNFVIFDNLGNQFYCSKKSNYVSNRCIWHSCNTNHGNGEEIYYYLEPTNRLALVKGNRFIRKKPTGSGYATQEIVIGIPLFDYDPMDYNSKSKLPRSFNGNSRLHFNPMIEDYEFEQPDPKRRDWRLKRINSKCYFQLDFFIDYSEEEMFKLTSISVKPRITDNIVSE